MIPDLSPIGPLSWGVYIMFAHMKLHNDIHIKPRNLHVMLTFLAKRCRILNGREYKTFIELAIKQLRKLELNLATQEP